MKKVCAISKKEFEITDADLKFYEKMEVPLPKLCPDERQRRRLAWRNERNLYRRKCDLCQKKIIAMYPADAPFPVFCPDCWFSEKWNATDFGRDFDFSQKFFPQFQKLQNAVPRLSLINARNENSEYCNLVGDSKNCYLIFGSLGCEDCLYGRPERSKDCVDSLDLWKSELCYESVDSENLYQCLFCQNCANSQDLNFCFDVRNSHDCFLCAGIRNAEFQILNRPCTRDEYFEWKKKWPIDNLENLTEFFTEFEKIKRTAPRKNLIGVANENVVGDHVSHSKNCSHIFNVLDSEDLRFVTSAEKCKTCQDADMGEFSELIYEMCGFHRLQDARFSHWCWDGCQKITYCSTCRNTKNSFGCVGMDGFENCILNKKYSPEEFEKLRTKIIQKMRETGEWGEFFPVEISPFAYNETVAQEYFPLEKFEVLARGWRWRDPEKPQSSRKNGEKKSSFLKEDLGGFKIPENISKVDQKICSEILACKTCGKNYKIQTGELEFYKKMSLPIPQKCPDCRHFSRMKLRNPRELFSRKCANCEQEICTTFSPDRPEKVLCEKCYQNTVS